MDKIQMIQLRNKILQQPIKIDGVEYETTANSGFTLPQIINKSSQQLMDFSQFIKEIRNKNYKQYCKDKPRNIYFIDEVPAPSELIIKFKEVKEPIEYKFFGRGRYFGFELEVERAVLSILSKEELINIIGKNREWLYFMEDPSLINGFEIISHPCSINFLKKNLPKLLEDLKNLNLTSYYTAGLHFHVSRSVFGHTNKEQLSTIGNLIKIVHNNFSKLEQICGRTTENLYAEDWKGLKKAVKELNIDNPLFLGSKKDTDNSEYVHHILKKDYTTDNGNSEVRNKAINLLKKTTVEFRLPQSTLHYEQFIGLLDLYNVMIDLSLKGETDGDFLYLFKNKSVALDKYLDTLGV